MPNNRSSRTSRLAYHFSRLQDRWLKGAWSRSRSGVREKIRVATVLDSLEPKMMLAGTGQLEGTVWFDANENEVRDTDTNGDFIENGVEGVRVFVDANSNLNFDAGEISALTNVNGDYVLENVPAGEALVRIDVPDPGDLAQFPNGAYLTFPDTTLTSPPGAARVSDFNIEVVFPDNTLSASQQAVFSEAAARWSEVIFGDLPDVFLNLDGSFVDDVRIEATGPAIDGVGGILGQAGPREVRSAALGGLTSFGIMQFDSADLGALEADPNNFRDVILHEMGHVLGIGTLWNSGGRGLLTGAGTGDPRFNGLNAVTEYQSIFQVADADLPIENTGGAGTRDAHWRETIFDNEIMTGFINDDGNILTNDNPLSRITIGSLEDLGYDVEYTNADFYDPLGLAIVGSGGGEPGPLHGGRIDGILFGDSISDGAGLSSIVAPPGYRIEVEGGVSTTGLVFGIAAIEGDVDQDTDTDNRAPIVGDQSFEIITFNDRFDPAFYPDFGPNGIYVVGQVEAIDVDGAPDGQPNAGIPDQTGDNLYYKIVGGNVGDEEKAFNIVKDQAEADLINGSGVSQTVVPGTIYVNNQFMIQDDINLVNGRFDLKVLVSDEDPDTPSLTTGDSVGGDFGVRGDGYTLSDVTVTLVDYNRIGETGQNNDSLATAQRINEGDPNTHERLRFNLDFNDTNPDGFITTFVNENVLGDPQNLIYGPQAHDWAYIDASISDRVGARDVDFYEIELDQQTGLFLDIDAQEELGSQLDAIIRVYDSNGSLIATPEFNSNGQAVSSRGYDFEYFQAPRRDVDAAGLHDDARSLDPSLYVDLAAGTYYVQDEGRLIPGTGTYSTGDYRLKVLGDTTYDPSVEIGGAGSGIYHNTQDINGDGLQDNFEVDVFQQLPPGTFGEDQFVVYLDFDGGQNVAVPSIFGSGVNDIEGFDFSGDSTEFSPGERLAMQNIFRIVREDLAPFNINVTTNEQEFLAANAVGNAYRVYITETLPDDFTSNPNTRPLRRFEGDGAEGFVFSRNVRTFSPGDAYPSSGRIVAAAIETGNYISNLVALNANKILGGDAFDPYAGAIGETGNHYADAIIGGTDLGLDAEYWHYGITSERTVQWDDDLLFVYGYRNGAGPNSGDTAGVIYDYGGQIDGTATDPLAGDGGYRGGNISTLTQWIDIPLAGDLDPRGVADVYSTRGTISSAPYRNAGPARNEQDFDVFRVFTADTSYLFIDVDEYATNIDLQISMFQVNNQGTLINFQDFILSEDENGNLVQNGNTQLLAAPAVNQNAAGDARYEVYTGGGTALNAGAYRRADQLDIRLSDQDIYLDMNQLSGGGARIGNEWFISVHTNMGEFNQENARDRLIGNYELKFVRQERANTQPFAPDQTVIRLDEQPEFDPNADPAIDRRPNGFVPYDDWFRIGQVELGSLDTAFGQFTGDPQNPTDGGEFGQIWQFTLRSVRGNKAGTSSNIADFDEFLYVDSGTGDIYLLDPTRLDFEEFAVYNLLVDVSDNGDPGRQASVSVDIVLNDVNEKPIAGNVSASIDEDSELTPAQNLVVGRINVSDPDDDSFNYEIIEIVGYKDREPTDPGMDPDDPSDDIIGDRIEVFRVDAAATPNDPRLDIFRIDNLGQIIVNDPTYIDFEDYDYFEFKVRATEDRATPNPSVIIDVDVTVNNVNERPRFIPTIGVGVTTQIPEDITNGSLVFRFYRAQDGTLRVIDDDNQPEGAEQLTFSVISARKNNQGPGSAAGVFGFDNSTPGRLGELLVLNSDAINYEDGPPQTFTLTVRVQDDGLDLNNDGVPDVGTVLADTVEVTIQVTDVQPEPPKWSDQTFSVDENSAVNTRIDTAEAVDDDGDTLTYSLVSQTDISGNPITPPIFDIDPATGDLIIVNRSQLSFEQYPTILVTGEVTDGTFTDQAVFTINLNDIDEEPPTGPNPQNFTVVETVLPGVGFGTVIATDSDAGQDVVAFDITAGNNNGIFQINDNGVLSVAPGKMLDYETTNRHVLTVTFYDNDVPAQSGTVQVIVNVLDVNEPPVLPNTVLSIPENTENGVRVNSTPIRATDPENNLITYSIVGGNTKNAFSLSPASGGGFNLFVNNSDALDFEQIEQFRLSIQMRDNGNPQATSTAIVTINLIDIDEFTDIASRVDSTGQWLVWRSSGSNFTVDNFGLWSRTIDWSDVMTGDFNNDKRTDIIGRDPANGRWFVGTTTESGQLSTTRWGAQWLDPQNYVDFQVGDFNGDGRDDIAGREITTGRWRVGLSTGTTFTDSFWATATDDRWNPQTPWQHVGTGDFNGDGRDDLIGQAGGSGAYYVALSNGSTFDLQLWDNDYGTNLYVDQLIADFDGDGLDDHAARRSYNGRWRVNYSTGSGFQTIENAVEWDAAASWQNVQVGDFDADGTADIVGLDTASRDWFVSISNGRSFTQTQWADWSTLPETIDHVVGDFDGDGADDIAGRQTVNGRWRMGLNRNGNTFISSVWGPSGTADGYVDTVVGQFDVPGEQPANNVPAGSMNGLAVSSAEFDVDDNAGNGTAVGSVTYVGGDNPSFAITGGNAGGAFGLVDLGNGQLRIVIANANAIDRFVRPDYTLVITGTDGDVMAQSVVRITVVGTPIDADFDDIIAVDPNTGRWSLSRSTGSDFQQLDFGQWSIAVDWQHVQFADFDGNGLTDVVAQNPATGRWTVGKSDGNRFVFSNWGTAWSQPNLYVDHVVGDFNGDGRDDIAARNSQTGAWRMGLSTGTGFTDATWTDTWRVQTPWTNVMVGDFNGDGRDDIYGLASGSQQQFVAISTGTGFQFSSWGDRLDRDRKISLLTVGDFNGDGLDDVAGRSLTDGWWHIDLSTGTGFTRNERVTAWTTAGTWDQAKALDLDGDGDDDLLGQYRGRNWYGGLVDGTTRVSSSLWARWPQPSQVVIVDPVFGDFNGDGKDDLSGYRELGGKHQMALSIGTRFSAAIWGQRTRGVDWAYSTSGQFSVADASAGGDLGVIAQRPTSLKRADEMDSLFAEAEAVGDLLSTM